MPLWIPLAAAGAHFVGNLIQNHKQRSAAEADQNARRQLAMQYLAQASNVYKNNQPLRDMGFSGLGRFFTGRSAPTAFNAQPPSDPRALLALLGGSNIGSTSPVPAYAPRRPITKLNYLP